MSVSRIGCYQSSANILPFPTPTLVLPLAYHVRRSTKVVGIYDESTGAPAYDRGREFVTRPPVSVAGQGVLAIRSWPGARAKVCHDRGRGTLPQTAFSLVARHSCIRIIDVYLYAKKENTRTNGGRIKRMISERVL
jgi:hypothetical protein